MRQVLVKKSPNVKELSFNKAVVSSDKIVKLAPGLNTLHLPFYIEPINEAILEFKFELPEEIAQHSVLLAGAYQNDAGDKITVMLYNLTQKEITIFADNALLLAIAYESIMIRQIDGMSKDFFFNPTEPTKKTKKGRKKKI